MTRTLSQLNNSMHRLNESGVTREQTQPIVINRVDSVSILGYNSAMGELEAVMFSNGPIAGGTRRDCGEGVEGGSRRTEWGNGESRLVSILGCNRRVTRALDSIGQLVTQCEQVKGLV